MSIQLTQQQLFLVKQLKANDPDLPYKGFTQISSSKNIQIPETSRQSVQIMYEVDYDSDHAQVKDKLLRYRRKSDQIYKVGELIKQYQSKFTSLMQEKDELVDLITKMKGSTSQLVQKQKKMIDLSMKMKQSFDYYSYHDKFNFDYPCEIACREMFENLLQPTLSELTDGVQYFQQNTTYSQNKKYLSMFQASKSKILSFVKSFFIKLFNKEQTFINKNCKMPLLGFVDSFYPKSKMKFISSFILHFPQFQTRLQNILKSIKESSSEDQTKFLEMKEMEIYQFQLNKNNIALIGYLQKNMPQIYNEAILTFFTFNRLTLHQNLIKVPYKKQGNFWQIYAERLTHMIYIISCEYAYECYCCRASTHSDSSQVIKANITAITKLYTQELMKFLKDSRNNSPFELCQIVTKIKDQIPVFLENYMLQQYQSYAFGAVSQFINKQQSIQYLKSLFVSFTKRILAQMETMCFNSLSKFTQVKSKKQVEEQVKLFLASIPKLKYCENQAQKYLIGALDVIVKSIKEVNSKIQSRFECYVWNIQIFGNIKGALKKVRGNLIRKQLKLDVNNSANIIERFKNIERNQSLLKYAQDVFHVIKAGMPVINELTLDFNKFINEHCQALQSQFVKDILFIYAKSMIQFIHSFAQALKIGQQQAQSICTPQVVQNLYATYVLTIEKYVKEANSIIHDWKAFKIGVQSEQIIYALLNQVYERLFDLLDKFYVNTSKFVASTQNFKEIESLKQMYKKNW